MTDAEKEALIERDICTKFITPALVKAGWDVQTQIREEAGLTKGRVLPRDFSRCETAGGYFELSKQIPEC